MTPRTCLRVFIAVLGLLRPAPADACSCGGTASSATALRNADFVFLGTVVKVDGPKPWTRINADGSFSGGIGNEPRVTTFETMRVFRGLAPAPVFIVASGTTCDITFTQGEVWLVYARIRDGRITTSPCTRTRLHAEAESDLAYLDGFEGKRPQGIVYGEVLRRIVDTDGKPALQALFEPLQVIADGPGGRRQITTDRWGPHQLLLPPGDYEIRVERAGRVVSARHKVRVEHGSEVRVLIAADYVQ